MSTSKTPSSIAIVTGGKSGIGKAIVDKLITSDACTSYLDHVLVVSRSISEDDVTQQKIIPIAADIGTTEGRDKIVNKVKEISKPLQFVIHSAGSIQPIKSILQVTEQDFTNSVAVNLQGPILLTTALVPFMTSQQSDTATPTTMTPRVLHVSSGAAHGPPPIGWSLYGITKAAFYQAYQILDQELNGHGVRVGSFKPGKVDTDMQGLIRQCKDSDMPLVKSFQSFKDNMKTTSTNSTAKQKEVAAVAFQARPPPSDALDVPENVACFVEWLLLKTTDDEFANRQPNGKYGAEYDIRDATLFPNWIPPENLPK